MLACLAGLFLFGCSHSPPAPHAKAGEARAAGLAYGRPASLGAVTSWTYQLQNYPNRLADVARSRFQMAVVDYSQSGGAAGEWTRAEVGSAKADKLLIAYLSIGEAEDYRYYWQAGWRPGSPSWIFKEDPGWPGNYVVQYWTPAWQDMVLGYLNRIIAQGFDGAYLDIVDAYDYFPNRPSAKRDMIAWVCRVSRHAKALNPSFRIITQNASELIWEENGALAPCIDGTAHEETWFAATDRRTPDEDRAYQLEDYAEYRRLGKPVFAVDYAKKSANIAEAYKRSRAAGLIGYVTDVNLDRIRVNPGLDPAPR